MSQQVEIDYTLNLMIGDMTYTDLRRIEMSMIRIGNDLNRIFPNSPASKIITDIQRIIMLARQAQIAIRAAEMAMIPGAGWIAGLYAATTAVGVGFSVYDSIATGT
jgi:hypothetical protein